MVSYSPDAYRIEIPLLKDSNRRQIVLKKGRIFDGLGWMSQEIYIFRYDAWKEDQLLEALVEAAKDEKTSFSWYDADVISNKVRQYLINQADHLLNI